MKAKALKVGLILVTILFCPHSIWIAIGGDCDNLQPHPRSQMGTPTVSGNHKYSEEWRDAYKPEIHSSAETIPSGDSIDLWVDTNGRGCPPYTWCVNGTGYSLSATTTYRDGESVQLSCSAGT